MKKKEIKKTKLKPRTKAEVMSGQFGVLLECMNHKFDLMTEGFSVLNKKFDRLDKKVDDNHKETNNHFKTLFKFKDETNANFKTNFEYLSQIDNELQWIKTEIADLKVIFKGKAELKRVIQVEKQMIVMQEQIDMLMMA